MYCPLVNLNNNVEEVLHELFSIYLRTVTDMMSLQHANESILRFTLDGGVEKKIVVSGPIIGADGAGSKLRYQLRDAGILDFTEEFCVPIL